MGGDTTSARHRVLEQNKGWSLDAFGREVHVPFFKQRRSCEFDRSWLINLETGSQVTVGKTLRERNSMPHGGSIARLDSRWRAPATGWPQGAAGHLAGALAP